jgi:hypothetical protein
VLDLSRLEAGLMKWQMSDYDMSDLVRETVMTATWKNDNRIHYDFLPLDKVAPVHTDLKRFQQVLLNMLLYPVNDSSLPERTIGIFLTLRAKDVSIRIEGSPLIEPTFRTQETVLKTDINRLFFHTFGGTYETVSSENGEQAIIATYPLAK